MIQGRVRARFGQLERRSEDIIRCHVDVERHARDTGDDYRVFIQLTLARGDVVRVHDEEAAPEEDVARAIDTAFDQLTARLVESHVFKWGGREATGRAQRGTSGARHG